MNNKKCEYIDLIGFIEGVKISEAAKKHIGGCAECREEIKRIMAITELAGNYLKSAEKSHPETSIIVDYAFGELKNNERRETEMHLKLCDKCREETEMITHLAKETDISGFGINEELPSDIKKKLRQLKTDYLTARLKKSAENLKAKGDAGMEKIKELVKETIEGGRKMVPVAASPDDITKIKSKKSKKKKQTKSKKDKEKKSVSKKEIKRRNSHGIQDKH